MKTTAAPFVVGDIDKILEISNIDVETESEGKDPGSLYVRGNRMPFNDGLAGLFQSEVSINSHWTLYGMDNEVVAIFSGELRPSSDEGDRYFVGVYQVAEPAVYSDEDYECSGEITLWPVSPSEIVDRVEALRKKFAPQVIVERINALISACDAYLYESEVRALVTDVVKKLRNVAKSGKRATA